MEQPTHHKLGYLLPVVEIPAPNTTKLYLPGGLTLMYSYSTCVGFAYKGKRTFTATQYSMTTSKHMKNVFEFDKWDRVPAEFFDALLESALREVFNHG